MSADNQATHQLLDLAEKQAKTIRILMFILVAAFLANTYLVYQLDRGMDHLTSDAKAVLYDIQHVRSELEAIRPWKR